MPTIEEKRVYGERTGRIKVLVAADVGLVVVSVSGDSVGEFGVEHRCTARDVTTGEDRIAVATDDDVLLGTDPETLAPAGFGPAAAVGFHDGSPVAADDRGRVARFEGDRSDEGRGADGGDGEEGEEPAGEWRTLGRVGVEVRAVDGPLVAAANGVHRIAGTDLTSAGLDDVRDVAGRGVPLAATASGLYTLGNGWMDVLNGEFDVVDADEDGRAHAVGRGSVYARRDGEWTTVDLPTDDVPVAFAYARDAAVTVTADGNILVDAGEGWRAQALGLANVAGVSVR